MTESDEWNVGTMNSGERKEIEQIIWHCFDGSLSEAQLRTLHGWLQSDNENIRTFLRRTVLHRDIKHIFQEEAAALKIAGELAELAGEEPLGDLCMTPIDEAKDRGLPATQTSLSPSAVPLWRRPLMVAAIAASLVTGFFSWSGMLRAPSDEGSIQEREIAVLDDQLPAATVTGLLDVHWSAGFEPARYGELLPEGRRLRLDEGVVQLTFESGAKMLLQGPSDFLIRSEMRGLLDEGKLAAVVPRRASGFTVRTPSAEVVDLGTEFAVEVDETGASEVHVFDGEVISQALDSGGGLVGRVSRVTEASAVAYAGDATSGQVVRFDGTKFVRELEPKLTESELPQLRQRRHLALWLAASELVKLDESGGVVAWKDILVGDNQSAEDALQPFAEIRPQWVEDAINGQPALRFDGKSHLTTTPLETTDDQTVSIVFSSAPGSYAVHQKNGCQLINYNGPPVRKITSHTQPGILQIGDATGWSPNFRAGIFSGMVYTWRSGKGYNTGRAVTKQVLPEDEPIVLTYIYDHTNEQARLYINGEFQQSNRASAPPSITSRKVIGCHAHLNKHFIGDIAELLIYNTALKERQRKTVEKYLHKKYSIPLASE